MFLTRWYRSETKTLAKDPKRNRISSILPVEHALGLARPLLMFQL
jgi:hypothetical protein